MRAKLLLVLLGAALGAAIFSGGVVIPMLFRDGAIDRMVAGLFAARIFAAIDDLFIVVALACLLEPILRRPLGLVCAAIVVMDSALERLYFSPLILAHGEGWPGSFGSLHAVASSIYLLTLAAVVGLAIILARAHEGQ